jgi:hypothetical protein
MIPPMGSRRHAVRRSIRSGCALLAAAGVCSASATAVGPEAGGPVDLSSEADVRIDGPIAGERLGRSVAAAGDVNGDGDADLIIGSPFVGSESSPDGAAYVVFGRGQRGVIDIAALGAGGFTIHGHGGAHAGASIGGLPDMNGDGLAEVIVGAPQQVVAGERRGAAFVVFGKRAAGDVDLSNLGPRGFRISGSHDQSLAGYGAAGAGDVNGDGFPDLVLGAPNLPGQPGSAWVVFGRPSPQDVDLAHLQPGQGFRIDEAPHGPQDPFGADFTGWAVDGAGDVNGDGLADVVVGALADPNGTDSGSAYVVFGKRSGEPVDLGSPPAWGFRIDGMSEFDGAGEWVAGGG